MTDLSDIKKIGEDVAALKTDMAKLSLIAERLETTSEKLTVVSANVSQILAVQDQRLKNQEKTAERVQELMERRREDVDAAFSKVYGRAKTIEDDLQGEIDTTKTTLEASLTVFRNGLVSRIDRLEKGAILLTGGFGLLVWLLENSDKLLPMT